MGRRMRAFPWRQNKNGYRQQKGGTHMRPALLVMIYSAVMVRVSPSEVTLILETGSM